MNLTEEQVAEEAAKIKDESGWPNWPILPMKNLLRRGSTLSDNDLGCMFTGASTVWLVNMFSLGSLTPEELKRVPREEFASVEDMVRAGWVGD